MYGDKDKKNSRLAQIIEIIKAAGAGITQAALALRLGVSRSVINKDLVTLHTQGVRLAEDDEGRVSWPE
jgi:predicted DNA-binding transcriptional regulator YafY